MPRGGARQGAGRPRKPLADKLIDGNPGKREITILKFSGETEKNTTTKPPSYLDMTAKEGNDNLPTASEIYIMLEDFVRSSGCEGLIAKSLIEDFAFLRRAYLECEYMNRTYGRIASGKRSPYVRMALDYQKSMMDVYGRIWDVILRNCEEAYSGKNAFIEMLENRGF